MFILKIHIGIVFLIAGAAKLAGAKLLADQFEYVLSSKIMMYLVGMLGIAGAVGLFFEPLTLCADLGLAGLMVGAIANSVKAVRPGTDGQVRLKCCRGDCRAAIV